MGEILDHLKVQKKEADAAKEEASSMKNRMKLSEMSMQRAVDRVAVLEVYEKKAREVERELEDVRNAMEAVKRGREEEEARHKQVKR